MKKIIVILLILIGLFGFTNPAYAVLNTHAVDLDTGDYFSHADIGKLSFSTDFTFECWINPDALTDDGRFISKEAPGDPSYEFGFDGGTSGVISITYTDSGGSNVTSNNTDAGHLTNGTWTHVAAVQDIANASSTIFINGLSVNSTVAVANATDIKDSAAEFNIGGFRSGTLKRINGQMDECRMWDHKRTGPEIFDNYLKHLTGEETGLIGYWRFNDDSAKDYTSTTSPLTDLTEGGSPTYQDPDTGTGVPFAGTADAVQDIILFGYQKLEESVSGV